MRYLTASLLAIAAAGLVAPASAQDGARILIPDPSAPGRSHEYVLVLVPKGTSAETSQRSSERQQTRSDGAASRTASAGASPSGQADARSGSAEDFVRRVYDQGYLQGRLAERRSGGATLTRSDLERVARQLYVRGYVQGRLEEQMGGSETLDSGAASEIRAGIDEARDALRNDDAQGAKRALRKASRALRGVEEGEGTGSVSRSQRSGKEEMPDRIAPGTVTGHLPIPIPEADSQKGGGGKN